MKMITMFTQMPLYVLFVTIAVLASSLKYQVEGISGTVTKKTMKYTFKKFRRELLDNIETYETSLDKHNRQYKGASKHIKLDQYITMQNCSSFLCKIKYYRNFLKELVAAKSENGIRTLLTSDQSDQTNVTNRIRRVLDELYNIKKCESGDGCVLIDGKPFPTELTPILKLEWKVFESVKDLGRILKKIMRLRDFQML